MSEQLAAIETQLKTLATDMQAAEQALTFARAQVSADKAQRRVAGVWARVVDFFSTTPAETNEHTARLNLERLQGLARDQVPSWLRTQVNVTIALSTDQPAYASIHQRYTALASRRERVAALHRVASSAKDALEYAASQCSSASNMELLDAVSTNKTFSVLSSIETSGANDALRRAQAALQALAKALPRKAGSEDLPSVDDTLDLIVDFALDPAIDVLSFFNMSALNNASDNCNEVVRRVTPLVRRITESLAKIDGLIEEQKQSIAKLESPYFENAVKLIPAPLSEYSVKRSF